MNMKAGSGNLWFKKRQPTSRLHVDSFSVSSFGAVGALAGGDSIPAPL
jgi:hypothetical protein